VKDQCSRCERPGRGATGATRRSRFRRNPEGARVLRAILALPSPLIRACAPRAIDTIALCLPFRSGASRSALRLALASQSECAGPAVLSPRAPGLCRSERIIFRVT